MKRVTGIGGIFFKSPDPKRLSAWYRDHLGLDVSEWGGAIFQIFVSRTWIPFLPRCVQKVALSSKTNEPSEFGKFAWVIDPDGNKVELWEPPAGQ